MADLAALYALATSKGGAPSGASLSALAAWCAARGSSGLTDAVAIGTFIAGYSAGGSQAFTTPGTYSFTVPYHATLGASSYGAGGGGGGVSTDGGTGSLSHFASTLVAYGGAGGQVAPAGAGTGNAGAAGTASGGTTTTGGGAAGGVGAHMGYTVKDGNYDAFGGTGGNGGLASYTWAAGTWTPGQVVTVVVGAGGTPGAGAGNQSSSVVGGDGAVYISWA